MIKLFGMIENKPNSGDSSMENMVTMGDVQDQLDEIKKNILKDQFDIDEIDKEFTDLKDSLDKTNIDSSFVDKFNSKLNSLQDTIKNELVSGADKDVLDSLKSKFDEIENRIHNQTSKELDKLKSQVSTNNKDDKDIYNIIEGLDDNQINRIAKQGKANIYNRIQKEINEANKFYGDGVLGSIFKYLKDKANV